MTGRRRHDHITDAIQQLGWLNAEELVKYHTLCSLRLAIVAQQPEQIAKSIGELQSANHDHDTRQANMFRIPRMRTEKGKRRLCYRAVKMLNELRIDPYEVTFRSTVKLALLDK